VRFDEGDFESLIWTGFAGFKTKTKIKQIFKFLKLYCIASALLLSPHGIAYRAGRSFWGSSGCGH
jgi:hypothetical protein